MYKKSIFLFIMILEIYHVEVFALDVQTKKERVKNLTKLQYEVTQKEGTEKPFENKYWNNKADGIYVDVVSGEPLFSSLDKYDSGTGWPSFTKPISDGAVKMKKDYKLVVPRTEVRSSLGDSHLGHVFDDGPGPTGERFCMNSASMRFIPIANMKKEGYGRFLFDFKDKKKWEIATLAGGCFWGVEDLLKNIKGVIETRVGYTGGNVAKATYDVVKTGVSGHAEAVQVLFDPKLVSYDTILLYFFKIHDPTTLNQQGNDIGTQYRSHIFYQDEKQKIAAQKIIDRVEKSKKWKKPVVTKLSPLGDFWNAEENHQKYLQKNPNGYTCHFERKIDF